MEEHLTVADGIVLDKSRLGKAIWLQAHFFSVTSVTLVKIDMKHTVV